MGIKGTQKVNLQPMETIELHLCVLVRALVGKEGLVVVRLRGCEDETF